jgi:ribosomal protein L32
LEEGQFTKQRMREREAHYIQSLPSVNKCVPGRSQAESHRISAATKVACPTCGKRVSRGNRSRHNRTRKCSLASNAAPHAD